MKTTYNNTLRILSAAGCIMVMMLLNVKLSAQDKGCCASLYAQDTIKNVSLKELSHEYRRLSRKPCEECFAWSRSGLQLVMNELGNRLEGKSKSEIRKAMGKPDEIQENQWIYDWRGMHDYLFFDFTDGTAKAQWYYAYE